MTDDGTKKGLKVRLSDLQKRAREAARKIKAPDFKALGNKAKNLSQSLTQEIAGRMRRREGQAPRKWSLPKIPTLTDIRRMRANGENPFTLENLRAAGDHLRAGWQQTLVRYPAFGNAIQRGSQKLRGVLSKKSNEFWITGTGVVLSAYFLSNVPALMWNRLISIPPVGQQPMVIPRVQPKTLMDYQIILDRCLVNSQGKCKEEVAPGTVIAEGEPVITSLPIDLVGVIILEKANGEIDERSLGTIVEKGNAEKSYPVRIGDEVPGMLRVTAVESNRVVFVNLRNNRNEFAALPEDEQVSTPIFTRRGQSTGSVEPTSNDRFSVARQKINESLEDLPTLITQVKATPTADGTYRLSQIVSGSLFEELGLKNNDELVSVNGESLTDPTKFLGYLEQLKSAQEVEITVKRGGQVRNLKYDIN